MWVSVATLCLSSTLKEATSVKKLPARVTCDIRARHFQNSQDPHVVVADIILLQPRPLLKLQVLDVLHHLQRAARVTPF